MSVVEFYDGLAPLYHLVYENWEASIERQGKALDSIIRSCRGGTPQSILDVSCGIGTQCLGLAALGHRVTGSDLSPAAVERAQREVVSRGMSIAFTVADMRAPKNLRSRDFDVVLRADNSLPHLLSDEEIAEHLASFSLPSNQEGYVLSRSETTRRWNPAGFSSNSTASAPRKAPGGSFFNCGSGVAQSTIYTSTSWLTTGRDHG